jgi:hypothetical protein
MLRMQPNRNLIPHRPCGYEDRSFAAKSLRGFTLQAIDRGVFTINIVADLGGGHRLAHGWGGAGHGVAAQVDHNVRSLLCFVLPDLLCRRMNQQPAEDFV